MAGDLSVAVQHRPDAVVVTARGDVGDDLASLLDLVGGGLSSAGRRPTLVDLCALRVRRREAVSALRRVLGERPPGSTTVVLAPTALRRRLRGLVGPEVAWYPAEVHAPLLGVLASLWDRRRQLPASGRVHPVEDPLGELVWAAARQRVGTLRGGRSRPTGLR